MKKFIALAILAVSSVSFAQPAAWTIRNTPDSIGTIYRTEAYGNSTRDKNTRKTRSAIALICSPDLPQPSFMIQWEGLTSGGQRKVNYTVDNKTPLTVMMSTEGDILYRSIASSQELLQSMKSGSILTVDWVGLDQTRYLTVFNLSTFRSNLSEFNKRCNTDV